MRAHGHAAWIGCTFQAPDHDLTSRESAPRKSRPSFATPADTTIAATDPPKDGNMAASFVPVKHTSSYYGSEVEIDVDSVASMSDYGSEFDATEIDDDTLLASTLGSITQNLPRSTQKSPVLPSIEFEEGEVEDEDQDDLVVVHKPSLLRVAKKDKRNTVGIEPPRDIQSSPTRETLEVEYDERSRRAWSGASAQLHYLQAPWTDD